MSIEIEVARGFVTDDTPRSLAYAAIAQAEALERIATALEQIAEQGKPVEAGHLNIRTGGET